MRPQKVFHARNHLRNSCQAINWPQDDSSESSAGKTATHETAGTASHFTKRLDIQGLRGIAVLVVLAFHSGLPLHSGFIGVDIFFVISGYVITGVLMRTSGPVFKALRNFFVRRFRRLVPALAVILMVTLLLSLIFFSPFGSQENVALTSLGASFGVANFVISRITGGYFDIAAETNPLLHTWSLSVEEQFYLLFPLLLLGGLALFGKYFRKHRIALLIAFGVTGTSFLAMLLGNHGCLGDVSLSTAGFYSPIPRAWEFGIGSLAFLLTEWFCVLKPWVQKARRLLAVGLLVSAFLFITESTQTPGLMTLLPVIGTALLLMEGPNTSDGPVTKFLSHHLSGRRRYLVLALFVALATYRFCGCHLA